MLAWWRSFFIPKICNIFIDWKYSFKLAKCTLKVDDTVIDVPLQVTHGNFLRFHQFTWSLIFWFFDPFQWYLFINHWFSEVSCEPDEYLCEIDNFCLPRNVICNGKHDCTDMADELNCNNGSHHNNRKLKWLTSQLTVKCPDGSIPEFSL